MCNSKFKQYLAVFLMFTGLAFNADAEESIVIDSIMLNEQSGSAIAPSNSPESIGNSTDINNSSEANANRERLQRGGKMSMRQKVAVAKAELAQVNKQEGESFLMANQAKQGVISLPSGVQYRVHKAGKGKKPTDSDIIVSRYVGTLIDGMVIDKSEGDGPIPVSVAGFLPGLQEAIKLMGAGSRWQIVVPSHLAYGERGDRGIGPNAVLIYEMEIISIK